MKQLMMAAVALGLMGCATTASSGARGSASEIDRAEIEATEGATTAHDLVRRLRPQWLRTRGAATVSDNNLEAIVVYVDGVRSGQVPVGRTLEGSRGAGPNPLEGITAMQVQRLVYYRASAATQRFGTGHAHGAIEVITRG